MRLLPALLITLAACGPSKGGDETGETSADTTAATTPGTAGTTGTSAGPTTTTTPPVTTGTTADDDCIDPPECEPCAPGCQQGSCVDGQWVCDCVPCGGTDPDTDTDTMTSEPVTSDPVTSDPTTMTTSPNLDIPAVEVDCVADPPVFPSFKGAPCMDNNECSLGSHQLDCCGSLQMIGFAIGDFDAFDAAEDTCRAQYPRCECAAQPTIDDDGNTSPTDFFLGLCVDNICKAVAQ